MKLSEWSQVGVWLADLVQVPRTTLQDAVTRGQIPAEKLGSGQVVVRIRDARAWAQREHKGKSSGL